MKRTMLVGTWFLCFSVFLIAFGSHVNVYESTQVNTQIYLKGTLVDSLSDIPQSRESDITNKFGPLNKVCAGTILFYMNQLTVEGAELGIKYYKEAIEIQKKLNLFSNKKLTHLSLNVLLQLFAMC